MRKRAKTVEHTDTHSHNWAASTARVHYTLLLTLHSEFETDKMSLNRWLCDDDSAEEGSQSRGMTGTALCEGVRRGEQTRSQHLASSDQWPSQLRFERLPLPPWGHKETSVGSADLLKSWVSSRRFGLVRTDLTEASHYLDSVQPISLDTICVWMNVAQIYIVGSEQSWPVLPGKLKSLLLPLTLIFLITNHKQRRG